MAISPISSAGCPPSGGVDLDCAPRLRSGKQVDHAEAGFHGVDHQLIAAVEGQDDEFEQSASGVEAEAQLTRRESSSRFPTHTGAVAALTASSSRTPCLNAEGWTFRRPMWPGHCG